MDRRIPSVSAATARRTILALGLLYVALAVARAVVQVVNAAPIASILTISGVIGVPGLVLLVGGYRLSEMDIRPEFYQTVARWCLGGLGVILGVLVLLQILTVGGIPDPNRTYPVFTALGSTAGFGVGIYAAQARTQAREVELRNRELRRAQRELEDTINRLRTSNDRLEQFAYAASHDLQEPLRMVSSYLRLIDQRYDDALDEDGREFLAFAVDGADRMRAMIHGLLDYSRIESQGEPFTSVDLEAVFDDVRADYRMLIAETGARVTTDPLPRVEGDESQLRQVFQNLLSNAIQYSGEEPPIVHVRAERRGSEWLLSVRDEGIGIDPQDSDRIFELFDRLHSRDEYAGTGIGLALCERIVERHGGTIWVDSDRGEGATVFFTLPVSVADSPRG
ncbi:sensor histidine kinase [Natrononativus amylolyticus]|uniref:sensor histidine kinase n=1 Tax=Natrononativus amylolyticus TaxID=2963434 RepID=UPI0020CF23AA|nr:ATP-binding protein [Natrononativus amylolyticus]